MRSVQKEVVQLKLLERWSLHLCIKGIILHMGSSQNPLLTFPGSPYNLCLKGKQGTQAQGWALAPGHTTRLGAQPGWGERQTSISTPGLFPSLLSAVGSPFHSLHRSVSLLCFRSTNTSPGKWEPQAVVRDERQEQISGENRAGKAYLKGCTKKDR